MYVFQVDTSSGVLQAIRYGFIFAAVAVMLVGVALLVRRNKNPKRLQGAVAALLTGVIVLATGVGLLSGATAVPTIVIRSGSISVSGEFIGNNTYPASEVKAAFVGDLRTGNLTLTRRDAGTSIGNINEEVYTLSNGAGAHVISINQTDLFVELDSGLYLVLGTSNTTALVSDFSAEVAPVSRA